MAPEASVAVTRLRYARRSLILRGGLIRAGVAPSMAVPSPRQHHARSGAEPLIAEGQAVASAPWLRWKAHLRILSDAGLSDGLLGDGGGILRRQGPG